MTRPVNNNQSWGLLLEPLQLDKHTSAAGIYTPIIIMTSYLEAVGATFEAYNRHCQLLEYFSFH